MCPEVEEEGDCLKEPLEDDGNVLYPDCATPHTRVCTTVRTPGTCVQHMQFIKH